MYDLNFYVLIWGVVLTALIPFVIFVSVYLLILSLRSEHRAEMERLKRLRNINYLISVVKKRPSPPKATVEEAIEGFKKNFMEFGKIGKDSKELSERLEFLSQLAQLEFWSIDEVVHFRGEVVHINPGFKKEIETAIGTALKHRESENKKNKKK